MPDHHGAWFAQRVIEVKLEYGLTVDPAERDALEALLASNLPNPARGVAGCQKPAITAPLSAPAPRPRRQGLRRTFIGGRTP